jgi:hypothetical protein
MGVRLLTTEHARVVVSQDTSVTATTDAWGTYLATGDASGLDIGTDADWFTIRPLSDGEQAQAEAYADSFEPFRAEGSRVYLAVLAAGVSGDEYDAAAVAKAEAALTDDEQRKRRAHLRYMGHVNRKRAELAYVDGPVARDEFATLPGAAREELGMHVGRISSLPKAPPPPSGSPSDTPTTRGATGGGAQTAPGTETNG